MLTKEIKAKIVKEARRHECADKFMFGRGAYESTNGVVKHCSIGCVRFALGLDATIGEHGKLCDPTGVPEYILLMSDYVFEGLPKEQAVTWTRRLWNAIPPGVDLAPATALICSRLMLDEEIGLAHTAILDSVKQVARAIGELYARRAAGSEPKKKEWDAAWEQAYAAAGRRRAGAGRRRAGALLGARLRNHARNAGGSIRMKFTIDRRKWRCGHEGQYQRGRGDTAMLNEEGFMCCLGHCALQIDPEMPSDDLLGIAEPAELDDELMPLSELSDDNGWTCNTELSDLAIEINDNDSFDDATREAKLAALFAEHGHQIEFTNEYVKP